MMQVTFLAHSGFLVELNSAALLFDWWKGDLPPLPEKPLLVFASHRHEDHFKPAIFDLAKSHPNTCFLLGKGIRLTEYTMERWGISPETAERCLCVKGDEIHTTLPGVTVETLRSTDEGVAFLVTADGQTIFHAGDLNWWHWEGEDKAWNHNMAANFKAFTEPLRGRHIDLAMLPLDHRLGADGFRGPKYFLELADIARFLPMHQEYPQQHFDFTEKFLSEYPQFADVTIPITKHGQVFAF